MQISKGFASWQRYCTHSSTGRQPNFAALNRGRHLYSAAQPSLFWALAHISSFICTDAVSRILMLCYNPETQCRTSLKLFRQLRLRPQCHHHHHQLLAKIHQQSLTKGQIRCCCSCSWFYVLILYCDCYFFLSLFLEQNSEYNVAMYYLQFGTPFFLVHDVLHIRMIFYDCAVYRYALLLYSF